MKPGLLFSCMALAATISRAAETNTYSSTVNLNIPDGSTSGLVNTIRVPQILDRIIDEIRISLTLTVPAGEVGFTGDLYAYIQHGDQMAVLLNRPGRGLVGNAGFNDSISLSLTFADDGVNGDIHDYRARLSGNNTIPVTFPVTGVWQPDGRATNPDTVLFSDQRTATLRAFDGTNPSDDWALYLADISSGGQYRITDWSIYLETTVVPEPSTWALISVFGCFALVQVRARMRSGRG